MWYALYAIIAISLAIGVFTIARSPSFWIELVEGIIIRFLPKLLKFFRNRPKTKKEWEDWRRLSSIKKSDMSVKDRIRYEELKMLNNKWKGKN